MQGLLKALHDEERDVRLRAALALGQIGHEDAIPGLLDALHNEECRWPGLLARPAWVVLKQRPKVVHLRDVFSSPGQYTINQNTIQR